MLLLLIVSLIFNVSSTLVYLMILYFQTIMIVVLIYSLIYSSNPIFITFFFWQQTLLYSFRNPISLAKSFLLHNSFSANTTFQWKLNFCLKFYLFESWFKARELDLKGLMHLWIFCYTLFYYYLLVKFITCKIIGNLPDYFFFFINFFVILIEKNWFYICLIRLVCSTIKRLVEIRILNKSKKSILSSLTLLIILYEFRKNKQIK